MNIIFAVTKFFGSHSAETEVLKSGIVLHFTHPRIGEMSGRIYFAAEDLRQNLDTVSAGHSYIHGRLELMHHLFGLLRCRSKAVIRIQVMSRVIEETEFYIRRGVHHNDNIVEVFHDHLYHVDFVFIQLQIMIVPITCAVKLVGVVARRKSAVEADLRKIAALACGSRQEDYSKIVIVFVRIFHLFGISADRRLSDRQTDAIRVYAVMSARSSDSVIRIEIHQSRIEFEYGIGERIVNACSAFKSIARTVAAINQTLRMVAEHARFDLLLSGFRL